MAISHALEKSSWVGQGDASVERTRYYVYIMANKWNTVLYTGMTNDLRRRVGEHRAGLGAGFSSKYKVHKLVYIESFDSSRSAVAREQQIKAGSRRKKLELIEDANPGWRDLADEL